jgi:hypothetical protein
VSYIFWVSEHILSGTTGVSLLTSSFSRIESPKTGDEGPEGEYNYSSTFSVTSALHRDGWTLQLRGRFTTGKETCYSLYRRVSGLQRRSGRVREISHPQGFDPRSLQHEASRNTHPAIPTHLIPRSLKHIFSHFTCNVCHFISNKCCIPNLLKAALFKDPVRTAQ